MKRILPAAALLVAATGLGPSRDAPVRLSDHTRANDAIRGCLVPADGAAPIWADNEPAAAVNPRNPRHLVAAWQTNGGGRSAFQTAVSTDGGATWSGPQGLAINACAGGPVAEAGRASDPWVTIGADGRVYVAGIAWQGNPAGGPDLQSVIVVVSSADLGRTWDAPRIAARGAPGRIWHDNVAITADPARPGMVHLVTTRYDQADSATRYGPAAYTVSRDGGTTWDPIRPITPLVNRGRISAPVIVADPRSGVLFLVYYRAERPDRVIGVRRSDDGGRTWSEESIVTRHVPGTQPQLDPLEGEDRPLADDIIHAATNPATGALVLAWADARREPRGRLAVWAAVSPDGRTWPVPVAVSDSSAETAWLPAVAVTDGVAGVLYLSGMMERSTSGLAPVTVLLRRFRLAGGGLHPVGTDTLDRANYAWPGDYHTLLAAAGRFRAVYGRGTLGASERFPPPDGDPRRTDPSDIYTVSR